MKIRPQEAGPAISRSTAATQARQQAFARELAQRLPAPPAGSTILVEEPCPAPGVPDPVASQQQLAGVLSATYHDASITGAILTDDVTADPDGLTVVTAQGARTYPYGSRLFVYNQAGAAVYPLSDEERADRYFLTYPERAEGC